MGQSAASRENAARTTQTLRSRLESFVPIASWLPEYNTTENLFGDLFGGAAVGLLAIAEGIAPEYYWFTKRSAGFAFTFLSGLPPLNGLYAAAIASLVYVILGTSPHVFLGTSLTTSMEIESLCVVLGGNVVICVMVRTAIERVSIPYDYLYSLSEDNARTRSVLEGREQAEVAATLTFMVAVVQVGDA